VALAVLAVLEIGAAVYVVKHNTAPKSPEADSSIAAQQQPSTSAAPRTDSFGIDATSAARDPVVIAFLGDDWTAGTGASSEGKRFSTLVCNELGAQERNFGVDGTGYAKSSASGGPYRSRLAALVAAHPQVVVVSGGRNDRSDYGATAADHARQLFTTLHWKLPDAGLVAVAPFWGDSDLPPELSALARTVRKAVTSAGGSYLDIADPIHGHPAFMADAADPNDRGYAAIAAALEPRLGPLLPR
jgi:lysophospholipase L1-like esterase